MVMTMAMVKVAEAIRRRVPHTEGRLRSVGENVDRGNLGRAQAVARRGETRCVRRGFFSCYCRRAGVECRYFRWLFFRVMIIFR